jgi:hypothetical protein
MRYLIPVLVLAQACCFADCVIPGPTVHLVYADGTPMDAAEVHLLKDGEVLQTLTCADAMCESVKIPLDEEGTFDIEVVVDGRTTPGPMFTILPADLKGDCCPGFYEEFDVEIAMID